MQINDGTEKRALWDLKELTHRVGERGGRGGEDRTNNCLPALTLKWEGLSSSILSHIFTVVIAWLHAHAGDLSEFCIIATGKLRTLFLQ